MIPFTQSGYPRERTEAALCVLREVAHVLAEYHDEIIVVGGWVPALLIPNGLVTHTGSLDVDLAVDHRVIANHDYYATMLALLQRSGYMQDSRQPFMFHRVVTSGTGISVEVDFLAGEYGGAGRGHRHQSIQEEMHVRKARGVDLAYLSAVEVTLDGELPDGTLDTCRVRVASMVPFLMMKAQALAGRQKPKDAWDIAYCLRHYPEGTEALADAFGPWMRHRLVQEGLQLLRNAFASPLHTGPRDAARFEEAQDEETFQMAARDAYERMAILLHAIGNPRPQA
jgi:hypothetical protein